MKELTSREIVERYAKAVTADDYDAQDALLADDVVEEYPQSGERVHGKANRRAIFENYPGMKERGAHPQIDRIIGSEDRWLPTPSFGVMRVVGTGDQYTATARVTYPNGEVWFVVEIIELRHGKIAKLTSYFGQAFEPPAWRSQWVERVPRS